MAPARVEIYLDHAATSPPTGEVSGAWSRYFSEHAINPSTVYEAGQEAKATLEKCRSEIASKFSAPSEDLLFTSGGTEGNQIAGWCIEARDAGTLWLSTTAHPSQRERAVWLKEQGWTVVSLPAGSNGSIDVSAYEDLPVPQAIAVEWVNSEAGFVQDLEALVEFKRQRAPGAFLWVDGVQGVGKLPPPSLKGIDAFVFSGHKMGAPVGIGGIFLPNGRPLFLGGGQERGLRSGTVSVPLVLCLKDAFSRCEAARLGWEEPLWPDLPRHREGAHSPFIHLVDTSPVDGEILVHQLSAEGICIGLGSACRASRKKPSLTHEAMGLTVEKSRQTLRVSFHPAMDVTQAEQGLKRLAELWQQSRRYYR